MTIEGRVLLQRFRDHILSHGPCHSGGCGDDPTLCDGERRAFIKAHQDICTCGTDEVYAMAEQAQPEKKEAAIADGPKGRPTPDLGPAQSSSLSVTQDWLPRQLEVDEGRVLPQWLGGLKRYGFFIDDEDQLIHAAPALAGAYVLWADLVAACPPPKEEPKRWWMVIRKPETYPVEATLFDRYDAAAMFWDRAQAQWSEVYFCRVVFGPRDVVGDMDRPVVEYPALPGAVPAQLSTEEDDTKTDQSRRGQPERPR